MEDTPVFSDSQPPWDIFLFRVVTAVRKPNALPSLLERLTSQPGFFTGLEVRVCVGWIEPSLSLPPCYPSWHDPVCVVDSTLKSSYFLLRMLLMAGSFDFWWLLFWTLVGRYFEVWVVSFDVKFACMAIFKRTLSRQVGSRFSKECFWSRHAFKSAIKMSSGCYVRKYLNIFY